MKDISQQVATCFANVFPALTEQHCIFRQPHPSVFAHSRDPEIVGAFQAGDSDHSRLDGPFWFRLPFEPWT